MMSFGIKANSLQDSSFGVIALSILFGAVYLIKYRKMRGLAWGTVSIIVCLCMEVILTNPDRRFIVPFPLPLFIFVLAGGLSKKFLSNSYSNNIEQTELYYTLRKSFPKYHSNM